MIVNRGNTNLRMPTSVEVDFATLLVPTNTAGALFLCFLLLQSAFRNSTIPHIPVMARPRTRNITTPDTPAQPPLQPQVAHGPPATPIISLQGPAAASKAPVQERDYSPSDSRPRRPGLTDRHIVEETPEIRPPRSQAEISQVAQDKRDAKAAAERVEAEREEMLRKELESNRKKLAELVNARAQRMRVEETQGLEPYKEPQAGTRDKDDAMMDVDLDENPRVSVEIDLLRLRGLNCPILVHKVPSNKLTAKEKRRARVSAERAAIIALRGEAPEVSLQKRKLYEPSDDEDSVYVLAHTDADSSHLTIHG